MRLSEALVCFRAFGDNFLRSITRAIVNKNDRKASEIIEKSTETSAKQCISKGKFEQSLKVHTKCAKSVNKLRYVKILLRNRGGGPPRCNILTYRSVFTRFAHFVCTFKLCLNFSFEIHCFAEVKRFIFQ